MTITRARWRKLLDQYALRVYKADLDPGTAIEHLVARAYFGATDRDFDSFGYCGYRTSFWKVERALHDEVGLQLANAVAKRCRNRLNARRVRQQRAALRRAA
jgi:hypothetical protein